MNVITANSRAAPRARAMIISAGGAGRRWASAAAVRTESGRYQRATGQQIGAGVEEPARSPKLAS